MILTLGLIGIIALSIWILFRKPKGIPPGPPSYVPILGNLVNLAPKTAIETLRGYRAKYGDIYSMQMGSRLVIAVNGYETIKDILVKHADNFSNRPDIFIFKEISKSQGLIGSSGSLWKEHRTFALVSLRQFGFGKRSMELDIIEEIKVFLQDLESSNGKPYNMKSMIVTSTSNVMCAMIFGKRFEHSDPKFVKIVNALEENFKVNGFVGLLNFIPILKYIPGDLFNVNRTLKNVKYVEDMFQELIDEHHESYDENNIRDYVDAFIKEMGRQDRGDNSTFTDEQLLKCVGDLFIAGMETTATTIRWGTVFLIHHPEVQEKMRIELEKVVGDRYPSINDRSELPYCEAVLTEILRCANIGPVSAPRSVDSDIVYKGFNIPKTALVLPILDSILSDPELFPEPETFDPSRFIDDQGNLCGQDKVLAFSTGRRACLGESLARMEVFLFLTSMIQRFKFLPEEEDQLPSLEGVLGVTRAPHPFKFRAIPRVE